MKSNLILLIFISLNAFLYSQDILAKLESISAISITKTEPDSGFTEAYEIMLQQPLNHQKQDGKKFSQRIILSHRDFSAPVVLITEGYAIGKNHTRELSQFLNANELRVEYRYFGDSKPDSMIWQFLNLRQAAADYHRIVKLFKSIYKNAWISTGWSKGGQTAVFYRYFYPNDVNATVAYDAPFNLEREEKRIDQFFAKVGTKECRQRLFNFQKIALQRKTDILPLLKDYAQQKNYTFSIGSEAAYEYAVLEYPFSFWQYHKIDCQKIPGKNAFPQEIFDHLKNIVALSSYSDYALNSAAMYQFFSEHGYYGYVIKGLEKWLSGAYGYSNALFAPFCGNIKFNPQIIQKAHQWQQSAAQHILYIYGENDPWSASAIDLKENALCIKKIVKKGNHFSFIRSFSQAERMALIETIKSWLNKDVILKDKK